MVNGLKQGKAWFALILLIPALFNFFLFWLYPNFDSILLSFQDSHGEWTIGNYDYVLVNLFSASGEIFSEALRNTLIYFSVGYFITQTLNVILAYFFYKKIAGYRIFRFLFYMPNILATVIMVSVYKSMLGPQGPIMTAIYQWGWVQEPIRLFSDTRYAMWASVGYSVWLYVGAVMLWSSGAMARIPKQLLEAAALDGITPWREFIYIVLPMISGTLSTLYIIGIAGILSSGGATLYLTFGDYGFGARHTDDVGNDPADLYREMAFRKNFVGRGVLIWGKRYFIKRAKRDCSGKKRSKDRAEKKSCIRSFLSFYACIS